jgi:hypothetical protein
MALNKMHGLGFLFTMLVVVLIVSPRSINNMYNNILGRVGLIALIIFFSMHNVTLGLLVALCIIVASNMYMFEGFDNASIGTGANIDPSLVGTGQNLINLKQELQQAQASSSTPAATDSTAATSTTAPATSTTSTTAPTTSTTSTTAPATSTTAPTTSTTSAPATSTTAPTTSTATPTSTTTTAPATTPTTITTSTQSTGGVDRQSIQQALKSKSSNTIPVNKGMFKSKYDEIAPSSSPSTTTQESFSSMGAPY